MATLVLDVAALVLHSWLHVLQRMHTRNASQHGVIACACCSHQKVTLQQTSLTVEIGTPTVILGIRCWMHQTQWQHPYCSSSGGAALATAGYSASSTNGCCSNKRENSTQQGQSYGHCSINRYYSWETDGFCSMLLFMVLYSILPTLAPA